MTEKLMKRLDEVCNEQIELVNQSHTGVSEENLQELVLTSITDNARISRGEILRACYGDSAEFKKYERIEQIINAFQRDFRGGIRILFESLEQLSNKLDLIPFLFYNKETGLAVDFGRPDISALGPEFYKQYCGCAFAFYSIGNSLLLSHIGGTIGMKVPALRPYIMKLRKGNNDLRKVRIPALHLLEAISDVLGLDVKYLVPRSKMSKINQIPEQKTTLERLETISKKHGLNYEELRKQLSPVHLIPQRRKIKTLITDIEQKTRGRKRKPKYKHSYVKERKDDVLIYDLYKLCDSLKANNGLDYIPVVLHRISDGSPELVGNYDLLEGVRNIRYVQKCLEAHRALHQIKTNQLDNSLNISEEDKQYVNAVPGITTTKLDWYCDRLGLVASYFVPVRRTPDSTVNIGEKSVKTTELFPSVF